jgi:protein TonB
MERGKTLFKLGFAALVSMLGCLMIFCLLDAMNGQEGPEKPEGLGKNDGVTITPKKKPPKTRKRIAKQRKRKLSSRPRAPVPTLAASLTGNSFGIPDLVGAELMDVTAGGLVDEKAVKNMVMTEEAVDVLPKAMFKKPPEYPERARAKGITGTVVLTILIGNNGEVLKVRVKDATPPGVFEEPAVEAIKGWQFQPAYYQGQAVKIWADIPVRFELT